MIKEKSFWMPVKPIKLTKSIKPTRLFGFEMNPKPSFNNYIKPKAPISPVKLSIYPKRTLRENILINKKPWADTDKDGVPNYFDCEPLNIMKQEAKPTNPIYLHRKKKDRILLPRIKRIGKEKSESIPFYPSKKAADRRVPTNKPYVSDERKRKPPVVYDVDVPIIIEDKDIELPERKTPQQITEDKYYDKWYKEYKGKLKKYGYKTKDIEIKPPQAIKKGEPPKSKILKELKPKPIKTTPMNEEEDIFFKKLAEKALGQSPEPIITEEPISEEKIRQREYIQSLLGKKGKWDKKAMVWTKLDTGRYVWRPTPKERRDSYKKLRERGASVELANRVKNWRPQRLKMVLSKENESELLKMDKERVENRIKETGKRTPEWKLEEQRKYTQTSQYKDYKNQYTKRPYVAKKIKDYRNRPEIKARYLELARERYRKPETLKKERQRGIEKYAVKKIKKMVPGLEFEEEYKKERRERLGKIREDYSVGPELKPEKEPKEPKVKEAQDFIDEIDTDVVENIKDQEPAEDKIEEMIESDTSDDTHYEGSAQELIDTADDK